VSLWTTRQSVPRMPLPSGHLTEREKILAIVAEDMARLEARESEVLKPRRQRRATGPSIVYSIRLDRDEVAALEAQAAAADMKPTALARNLIRCGLATRNGEAVARAVDRLETSVAELRALVP
jgi:hypothetical protein